MSDRTPPGIPPAKSGKPRNGSLIGCGVIAAIVILAFVGCTVAGSLSSGQKDNDNQYEAIAQCEARVERLLKAPSTAEFDSAATADSGVWTVTGTVDSENSFGAKIRSSYQCTVEVHETTATTTVDYVR